MIQGTTWLTLPQPGSWVGRCCLILCHSYTSSAPPELFPALCRCGDGAWLGPGCSGPAGWGWGPGAWVEVSSQRVRSSEGLVSGWRALTLKSPLWPT